MPPQGAGIQGAGIGGAKLSLFLYFGEVELASKTNNSAQAWKIVNNITNRKCALTEKLKGKSPKSPEERRS